MTTKKSTGKSGKDAPKAPEGVATTTDPAANVSNAAIKKASGAESDTKK